MIHLSETRELLLSEPTLTGSLFDEQAESTLSMLATHKSIDISFMKPVFFIFYTSRRSMTTF